MCAGKTSRTTRTCNGGARERRLHARAGRLPFNAALAGAVLCSLIRRALAYRCTLWHDSGHLRRARLRAGGAGTARTDDNQRPARHQLSGNTGWFARRKNGRRTTRITPKFGHQTDRFGWQSRQSVDNHDRSEHERCAGQLRVPALGIGGMNVEKTTRNLLIALGIGLLAGAGVTGIIAGRQLSDIRKSEAAVTSALADLKRQSEELSNSITAIGTGLENSSKSVAALGGQIQQLGNTVQSFGTSMESIKRDVGQIKSGQSDVDAKLSNLGNTISSLGESIHGLAEPIHSATTGVQQASDELSGTDSIIEQATGILQGLPKASQNSTK